ncbi:hypothetical protein [Micromonospora sp. 4G55]|uniref:hypothetical protein n=1 Tax=Micromonospora sp. 4G55 TaxID=2806102 RepID=UPI001EE4B51C|nr:hypothetical protein [Micromonospora sp. 4G55]
MTRWASTRASVSRPRRALACRACSQAVAASPGPPRRSASAAVRSATAVSRRISGTGAATSFTGSGLNSTWLPNRPSAPPTATSSR